MTIKRPLGETDPAYWNLHPAYIYDPSDDTFCDPMGTKVARIDLHYRRETQQMCGHTTATNWQQQQAQAMHAQQLQAMQYQAAANNMQGLNYGLLHGLSQIAGLAQQVPSAPHDAYTKKSEQMVAGEIIAWRAWHIQHVANKSLLKSVAADHLWMPHQVEKGDVLAGFGIHAYKDAYGPVHDSYVGPGHTYVVGQVAMWGDVIEHEKGWRSEFAKVHSLDHFHRVTKEAETQIRADYL